MTKNRKLATKIADLLFTAFGDVIGDQIIITQDGIYRGRWSYRAALTEINRTIKANEKEKIRTRKRVLIEQIAHFLADDQASKSVRVQQSASFAMEWVAMRNAAGVTGWAKYEDAIKALEEIME